MNLNNNIENIYTHTQNINFYVKRYNIFDMKHIFYKIII